MCKRRIEAGKSETCHLMIFVEVAHPRKRHLVIAKIQLLSSRCHTTPVPSCFSSQYSVCSNSYAICSRPERWAMWGRKSFQELVLTERGRIRWNRLENLVAETRKSSAFSGDGPQALLAPSLFLYCYNCCCFNTLLCCYDES